MSMKLIALLIDKQLQVISTVKISSRGQECNKMYYIVADFTFMANCSFNNNLIDQGHNWTVIAQRQTFIFNGM